jgi:hypothetical protein
LAQAIQVDANSEQAWLWLTAIVTTDAERRFCLERVLAINPENAAVQQGRHTTCRRSGAIEAAASWRTPMNDREREECAIWKLEQAGECVRRQGGRYLLTTPESVTELDDLAQLAAFADRVYADHWSGRKLTPSA